MCTHVSTLGQKEKDGEADFSLGKKPDSGLDSRTLGS